MNALTPIKAEVSLPDLVRAAAHKLANAESSAEVLEAREAAGMAYDAAKRAGRLARAKQAHDEIIGTVYRAQADALEIESLAKRRLADEYDAAQDRGEVASGRPAKSSNGEDFQATAADIGLSHKEIHEARQVRDAEMADPGVVRRTLDELVQRGEEPTKSAVRRAIAEPRQSVVSDDALWLWGRLRDFESKRIISQNPATLLLGMTPPMREDVRRLAPLVREFLEDLEVRFEPA